jgi:hypothetical protein
MSISAIVPQSPSQATDSSAKVQLQRDELKLVADTKANASQAQLAEDSAAIAIDQIAVAQIAAPTATSGVDIYL